MEEVTKSLNELSVGGGKGKSRKLRRGERIMRKGNAEDSSSESEEEQVDSEVESKPEKTGKSVPRSTMWMKSKGPTKDTPADSKEYYINEKFIFDINQHPPLTSVARVIYCPNCGGPPDYCEWNTEEVWEGCLPWVDKHFPKYCGLRQRQMYGLDDAKDAQLECSQVSEGSENEDEAIALETEKKKKKHKPIEIQMKITPGSNELRTYIFNISIYGPTKDLSIMIKNELRSVDVKVEKVDNRVNTVVIYGDYGDYVYDFLANNISSLTDNDIKFIK